MVGTKDMHGGAMDLMHFDDATVGRVYRLSNCGLIGLDICDWIAMVDGKVARVAKVKGREDAAGDAAAARGEGVRYLTCAQSAGKHEAGV